MDKANKVFWLVKMKEELALAASAIDADKAELHRQLAKEFERLPIQALRLMFR
jgi:hypothetical protein